ncbi:jg18989 [Pararge aegeria aegeria]|uniref:Jg18989 protein n=1 Tax=Pararge aegeria aegeria TaxID=348720 RepID=A0A8S4RFY9_9NEOP|nr:jg18989 [Pararge aegeria aegeria]
MIKSIKILRNRSQDYRQVEFESDVIVPIVIKVNILLSKRFDQHLGKLSLGCLMKGRMQKAVDIETACIVRSPGCWGIQTPPQAKK